ncbi:MAG: hypothetical protein KAS32_28050 [Candidatus Peribacteraceae bacterium]|nr:hypothetical protein [Candidatus Peribacteraceae bacterium]
MEKAKTDFNDLVEDLLEGRMSMIVVQNAIVESYKRRDNIPEGIKGIICGTGDCDGGLVRRTFQLLNQFIGNLELAYRRGADK